MRAVKINAQSKNKVIDPRVDEALREDTIKQFLPLVKKVVHRLAARLPADVDIGEMTNSGIIGLVDALEKYDPKHETNFATYAQFRIRGAILDSFRMQDWVPRSLRHKGHKLENAYLKLEQKFGRPAEDNEVASELGVDIETFRRMLSDVSSTMMMSFDDLGFGHGEERFKADETLGSAKPDPLNKLIEGERTDIIARALDRLPAKERLVVTLYFFEELNLKEIGEIISVTESRASQIRSRALLRLKSYLKKTLSS